MTITKDDWLTMSGKRKRGDEVIAFSERFKLPPNIDPQGGDLQCLRPGFYTAECEAACMAHPLPAARS